MKWVAYVATVLVGVLPVAGQSQATQATQSAAQAHQRAVAFHDARRLDEASRQYAITLTLDPPRPPSASELSAIRRFAPRLYTTASEFFQLRDFAAILHPTERLIAYHMFWEDDIDFPEDNDPCDHELVWVQYSTDGQTLERFWTYFHGRILNAGEPALREAREHEMRPRVNVQWGKHGSLPHGWESLPIVANEGDVERKYLTLDTPMPLLDYNRATWQKLRTEGRRLKDHALARRLRWPDRFEHDWNDFVAFSRLIDPLPLIDRHQMVSVSRWNNAVIDQQLLAYNFRAKTEWPADAVAAAPRPADPKAAIVAPATLDGYHLPPKTVFDSAMPRYPNVWFHVDTAMVDSYQAAVQLIAEQLRGPMRLRESHGPFSNPEGCDFEVTLEHLQPWEPRDQRALQHAHAFHMRYYHSALAARGLERVRISSGTGEREFYRIAASAHYEVEHTNPNHADVETCPICGRTGQYAQVKGNLVEVVHDPLGVELLLAGTIRDEVVRFEHDGDEVGGIKPMRDRFQLHQQIFQGMTADRNTSTIGIVVLSAAR